MESIRSALVQSIAVEVARSVAGFSRQPSAEVTARDPEFEAAVCESVRSWCGARGATLTCLPTDERLAGYGACLIEFGGDRLLDCSRMLVLLGDLGGVGIPRAWSILAAARAREQALVAVFVYRADHPRAPEPVLYGNGLLVPWWGADSLSENFLEAGLSTASTWLRTRNCARAEYSSPALSDALQAVDDLDCRASRLWKLAQWATLEPHRGPMARRRVAVAEKAFASYIRRLDAARLALEDELRGQ